MVSYVLQGVVTGALGPALVLGTLLKSNQQWPFYEVHERRSRVPAIVRELAIHSLKVNFINAMAVNFTIAARRTAEAPIFEASFGGALAMYQVWICLVSLISWHTYFKVSSSSPLAGRKFFHAIWFIAILVCFLVPFYPKDDGPSWLRDDVAAQCEIQRAFPRPESFKPQEVLVLGILAAIALFIFILYAFLGALEGISYIARSIFDPQRLVALAYAAYLTAALSYAMITLLRSMFHTRAQAKTFSNDAYEDDNWGFGQVMAVVLWLGFLSDAICIIRGKEVYVYLLYVGVANQYRCGDIHTLEAPSAPETDV